MRNWNKLYQSYVKKYNTILDKTQNKKSIIYKRKGMLDQMLSEDEFKVAYSALELQYKEEVQLGVRKKVMNVTRDVTQSQLRYVNTAKQVRVIKQAMEACGFKVKDYQIYAGESIVDEFFEFAKKVAIENKAANETIGEFISANFMGSP